MVPSLPLLSSELSVSVKENTDRKKTTKNKERKKSNFKFKDGTEKKRGTQLYQN